MSRLRVNGLGADGATNGASAALNSQTLSFAHDPKIPTIVFPDYLPVTLDVGNGQEEEVWVSPWTAGATSGSCIRNMEPIATGQNNQAAHTAAPWSHGPTAWDFDQFRPNSLFAVPSNFSKLRTAVAKVLAGTGSGKVLFVGTSISGGGGVSTQRMEQAPPAYLASLMDGKPCACKETVGAPNIHTAAFDDRWTAGSGWSYPATLVGLALNGSLQGALGAAGTATFSPLPTQQVDTFDIYCVSANNTGTVQAKVDGGADNPIVTNNAVGAIRKYTVTCPRGTGHVLNFHGVTVDPVWIVLVDAYDSTTPTLRVANGAVDGSGTAANFANAQSVGVIQAWAPDLTIIELAADDVLLGSPPTAAAFAASLATIVTACQASGDVMFWTQPHPDYSLLTGTQISNFEAYIWEVWKYAVGHNIPIVDIMSRFGTFAQWSPAWVSGDGVHPNAAGNVEIAEPLRRALELVI